MDGAQLLDQPGLDTYLARLLLDRGEVELDVLKRLLSEAREGREDAGKTLARRLLDRRVVGEPTLEAALADLARRETLGPRASSAGESAPQLGDFRLLDRLGSGGMGAVYRAEHVETGARYALKTLEGALDAEAILRFQREAEGHARVDAHPNVTGIHSFGSYPGGLYLVMDLVEGGSLEDRLAQGPLSPEESARLVRELCRGLEHIHQQGVLHRDLKPANVLMDGDRPRLTDFGLAKLVGEHSLTVSGTVLGTPAFMAPEQIDRNLAPLGPWSDVYGLGALLYRCLTGRNPFVGKTALAVMLESMNTAPPAPSALNPAVAPSLEAVCLRAMSKAHGHRYTSARAMGEALDGFLSGASKASGSRAALVLAGVGSLAVAGLLWAGLAGATPTPATEPREDEQPVVRVPAEATRATPAPNAVTLPLRPLPTRFPTYFRGLTRADVALQGEQPKAAIAALRKVLLDPLSGWPRPAAATRLARLLALGEGTEPALPEAEALLLESVLQGGESACELLAWSYLGSEATDAMGEDAPGPLGSVRFRESDELAAACVAIFRTTHATRPVVARLVQALTKRAELPSPADGLERLRAHYRATFPQRRLALQTPPAFPLPKRPLSPEDGERLERADRRSFKHPREALRVLEGLLEEPPSITLLRRLGRLLCVNEAFPDRRREGVNLLFESALRGDRVSARALSLASLPDVTREKRASFLGLPNDPGYVGEDLPTNLVLAGALGKIYLLSPETGDRAWLDRLLREGLEETRAPLPRTEDEAYEIVWRGYLERLASAPPPPLPLPMRPVRPLDYDAYDRAKRAERNGEEETALRVFGSLVFDRLTGQTRADPARRLAQILLKAPPPGEPPRAFDSRLMAAWLFEAALCGDLEALRVLLFSHLSPESRQDLGEPMLRGIQPLASDDRVALAALTLLRTTQDDHRSGSLVEVLTVRRGLTPPASREAAFAVLWEGYRRRFPQRASEAHRVRVPTFPIRSGTRGPDYVRELTFLRRRLPHDTRVARNRLLGLLYDHEGRLRTDAARHAALALPLDPPSVRPGPEDAPAFLLEATLRGDARSAHILSLGYAPPEIKRRILDRTETPVVVGEASLDVHARPRLAAAAALLALEIPDGKARIARALLEELASFGVERPPNETAAYETLWRAYVDGEWR